MNDVDLQELVIEELAFDPSIDAVNIAIAAVDGVVTLRGSVRSLTEKWQAVNDVKAVRGVVGIVDEIVVDLPAEHLRSDTDIARAVAMRIESNVMIPDEVKFIVKRGRITLSGEVAWNFQRDEVERESYGVTGVLSVKNDITLKAAPIPTADDVRRVIHSAFSRTADTDANNVFVVVDRSTVTLRGKVRSWLEHDKATQAAWNMRGVTRVDNRLEVEA